MTPAAQPRSHCADGALRQGAQTRIRRRFSSLFKRVFVEFENDQIGNAVAPAEWRRTPNFIERDGFEIKRTGQLPIKCRILMELDLRPPKFKVVRGRARPGCSSARSDGFGRAVGRFARGVARRPGGDAGRGHADVVGVHQAVWAAGPGRSEDDPHRRTAAPSMPCCAGAACSSALIGLPQRQVLRCARMPMAGMNDALAPLLLPPDPLVIDYCIDNPASDRATQLCFDLEVEVRRVCGANTCVPIARPLNACGAPRRWRTRREHR